MCEPISLITGAISLFSALGGGKSGGSQQASAPQKPVAPPQAAKVPEQATYKKGMAAVSDPTALTGPGGIPNDKLYLGKSTVLGA